MKILKKILKIVLVLVVLLVVVFWFYTRSLKPTYSGELSLQGLTNEVTVYFDANGVPHIQAQNQEDAYKALGYVHAQDRLWQMELIRRIAPGRLSEIFGKEVVATDLFFKGLGIEENTKETVKKLDKNSKSYLLTQAYLEGVNQFIDEGVTPIEFTLVGVEKEHYMMEDVFNVFGYMAFSFANAQKTDPFITNVKEKLGKEYLAELGVPIYDWTAVLRNEQNPIKEGMATAMHSILETLPVSPFIGSNSWVIGGEKTKSGKVIFANDPHIGFAQPSVWYQAHIKTPDYEIYAYNLALTPFALLGHNRDYAYGLTMFENDDVDFYFEENHPSNPNQYKTPEGYKNYEVLDKRIKIKDEKDSVFQVRVSKHGPIMNDVMKNINDDRPIAISWIYTMLPNKILDVSYKMSHANSLNEFREGAKLLHAPGLNIMYGDAKDNIAWFASGKLYEYRDSLNTKLILNGASGKDEIRRFLDFKENPQAVNPSWNFVYSANNQPEAVAGVLYPGYYLPEDRGLRIEQLLEQKSDWTPEDVRKMIFDVTSSVTPTVVAHWVINLDETSLKSPEIDVLKKLIEWDGEYSKQKVGPTIYTRMLYEFMNNTFGDELGVEGFEEFIGTHAFKKTIAIQAGRTESVWWDDITTDQKESKQDIIQKSFLNTVAFLSNQLGDDVNSWAWSRVASVEHPHALGKVKALRGFFNVGPFAMDGGNEVINNQIFRLNGIGYYKVHGGPSTRRVIDFADIENSTTILPTGQSGNVFSKHYKDLADKYLNGEFVKMLLNQEEIENAKDRLVFKPE